MSLAERLGLPILAFVDTPGAYPGIGAEERGQAEAIAKNVMVMTKLKVPIVVTVIGEGGSGGALALGVGDTVLMLEFATYTVISPESCAAILWRDAGIPESREGRAFPAGTGGSRLARKHLSDETPAFGERESFWTGSRTYTTISGCGPALAASQRR